MGGLGDHPEVFQEGKADGEESQLGKGDKESLGQSELGEHGYEVDTVGLWEIGGG